MRVPIIILTVVWTLWSQAQPTYMSIFRGTGTAKANIYELSSGNLFTGVARQSGTSIIDPEGNILHFHCHAIDTLLAIQSVAKYSDNEFYFTGGYYKDTCTAPGFGVITRIYPVIGRMDSMGNIDSARHYVLNSPACSNGAGDLEVTNDKSIVAWGRDAMFFALKVDSTLAPVWAKRFPNNGGFRFIKELPGGDLLAGFDMDTAGACVARLNANGSFLWCKSYMRPMGRMHDAVIGSDSSFIIMGYTGSIPQKLFMMKLDGEGEVQWCRGYDNGPNAWASLYPSRIVPTQDGKLAVLATLGQPQFPYFYRPFLMKTDLNGDTLWTRSVGASGYDYYAKDLLAYSDGGFVFNGRIWGDLPEGQANFAFLFKADSLGHLPCQGQYHPLLVQDLFPTDSSFTLTSVDGAVAMPAFVQDAFYDPITQYNGCTFLPTGIPSTTRPSRSMSIRPNPNTGRFTMAFKDPLMAESWYSVYDAMGKLLFQRPLQPGKETEEIDLSRYGKGTYVIKCTDPEGVYHERVVVE